MSKNSLIIGGLFLLLFVAWGARASDTLNKEVHRFALVVGNQSYSGKTWNRLQAPVKDANDVEGMLLSAGFLSENISSIHDANGRELKNGISRFGLKIRNVIQDIRERNAQDREAVAVLFFYSGHGYMRGNTAYLVGVDADGKYVEETGSRSYPLNSLIDDLTPTEEDVEFLSVLLVDACRTNLALPSRVAPMAKGQTILAGNFLSGLGGNGRIAVFASINGKPSYDARVGKNENSVFTAAILKAANPTAPPSSFGDFVRRVAEETRLISKERFDVYQITETQSTLISDFHWVPDVERASPMTVASLNEKGVENSSSGWVWLGNYDSRNDSAQSWQVVKFKTEGLQPPAPNNLMDGDKITILANLNVRASQPALDFMCLRKYHECKKLVGTLPRGLNVRVIGKPISVGNQYWAKVQFDQGALY